MTAQSSDFDVEESPGSSPSMHDQARARWEADGLVLPPLETSSRWCAEGWWGERTFWDLFVAEAERHPAKSAVVTANELDDARHVLTYGSLKEFSDRCAATLIDLGVAIGDVVVVQVPNWWEFCVIALACAKIGAVVTPLAPIFRRRDVGFVLRQTRCRIAIVAETFRGFSYVNMMAELQSEIPNLDHVFALRAESELPTGIKPFENDLLEGPARGGGGGALDSDRRARADDVALLMYTSGTTGEPKGVIHTHNTLLMAARASFERSAMSSDDVVLMCSTLGHLTGYASGFVMPLAFGMKVVYQDVWNAAVMLRLIEEEDVTWTMGATPFVLDAIAAQRTEKRSLQTFNRFACAGAPVPPHVVEETGHVLGAELTAIWGMTETGSATITDPGSGTEVVSNSDGRPVPWIQVRIVNDELEDLPIGETGRLLVRGASLFRGYFRRRDLYDVALLDGGGWFDTGDLAWMRPDGGIRIAGRTKDLIVRGGENVPVVEVEASIYRHPKVSEVAVVGYPDERLGERACAVVVVRCGEHLTLEEIQAHLQSEGVTKQFWPERLSLVSSLPKTASGKIQKATLRKGLRTPE